MRSLKFHSVRANNILCFGPNGIEIHFADYGNIVLLKGINHDAPGTDDDPASNGAGKSSIQELLSLGLFGRTVKSPTKCRGDKIINVLADKGEVEVQWDDFRVVRSFRRSKTGTITCKIRLWKSPNRIWDEDSEITKGSDDTQAEIEKHLGLTHHAFCNVVIFDDSNTYSFLEADADKKRQIVENLLDLDQYRTYHENAKDYLKDFKKQATEISKEYERFQGEVELCQRRLATVKQQEVVWRDNKEKETKVLQERIHTKQKQLQITDIGEQMLHWQRAQERITYLTDEISDLESKRERMLTVLATAREKLESVRDARQTIGETLQEYNLNIKVENTKLQEALNLISSLEGLKDGATCPYCHGIISRENYGAALVNARHSADQCRNSMDHQKSDLAKEEESYKSKTTSIKTMEAKLCEADAKVATLDSKIRTHRREIGELATITKPEGDRMECVLEAEIVELKKQLKLRREEFEGDTPYKEIVAQAEQEIIQKEGERDTKAKQLAETEAEMPYYEFWVEAFGDNGIRRFVIDGIIPSLNERMTYWLECLVDGYIELIFNNKLEATISRNGNSAYYYLMSNGERQRINLSVPQSFAYIMMLNSGTCPSVVFLDEITRGCIDRAGITGVYNLIQELAKERQVFVTTHNENLLGLLQGCETITLRKRDDITVLDS